MGTIRLATRRLELVPVEVSDRDWLHLALDLTRVRRYPWDDEAVPMDGVIEEIETSDARFATDGWGMWLLHAVGSLREAAPGGPIGTCGLDDVLCAAEAIGWPGAMVEVVFTIDPSLWKRGLAGEAAEAVLAHGHGPCGLPIIGGGHDRDKVASGRVLLRIGMAPFGSVQSALGPADYLIHRN